MHASAAAGAALASATLCHPTLLHPLCNSLPVSCCSMAREPVTMVMGLYLREKSALKLWAMDTSLATWAAVTMSLYSTWREGEGRARGQWQEAMGWAGPGIVGAGLACPGQNPGLTSKVTEGAVPTRCACTALLRFTLSRRSHGAAS